MTDRDRMIARNTIMDRARPHFMAKHDAPDASAFFEKGGVAAWDAYQAELAKWEETTGFRRFLRRVGNLAFRKLGYVKSPHGGWMRND